jgi:hypothetical protein
LQLFDRIFQIGNGSNSILREKLKIPSHNIQCITRLERRVIRTAVIRDIDGTGKYQNDKSR